MSETARGSLSETVSDPMRETVSESREVVEQVRPPGGVVVGDDGSAAAARALRFAAEEAARRGATLHVVRAWTITSAARPPGWQPGGYVPSLHEFQEATRDEVFRGVRDVLGEHVPAPVEVHVVHGPSAQALIGASQTADVLVVGTRGRGGFAELLLGSVAEQCVRHSHCPVIVVPRET